MKKITSGKLSLENIIIKANNRQQNLDITEITAETFGGKFTASATLNVLNKVPSIELDAKVTNLDMHEALVTLSQVNDISGQGNLVFKGRSYGTNIEALQQNLKGNGSFVFNNPRFNGMNIEQQYCKLAAMVERNPQVVEEWPNYTQFQDLNGTFSVANRQIQLSNVVSAMGNLKIGAKGNIKLLPQTYKIDVIARLHGDKTSDTGCNVKSKSVRENDFPLECKGDFAGEINCQPDPNFVRGVIETKITKALFGKLFTDSINDDKKTNDSEQSGTGTDQNQNQDSEKKSKTKPEDHLKNLLNDLLK